MQPLQLIRHFNLKLHQNMFSWPGFVSASCMGCLHLQTPQLNLQRGGGAVSNHRLYAIQIHALTHSPEMKGKAGSGKERQKEREEITRAT